MIWIFFNESNRHNGGATSYPSHREVKMLWCFRASQISDEWIIIIRFVMKKYIFVAEDLLWYGIGDKPIFVTQISQIMKDDENTAFSDINKMSQKPICVVVVQWATILFHIQLWTLSWPYRYGSGALILWVK